MASENAHNCLGWAARDPSGVLSSYEFNRRAVAADDVSVKITHCGVCYADVSWAKNLPGDTKYPVVPGHEIVGVVKEVGPNVDRFKVGDHMTLFQSKMVAFYFVSAVVDHEAREIIQYCYRIPDNYPSHLAAPLLCAGITVYSPMIHHNMNQPGKSLGVIGLGGLGHMAVLFGKAFGLKVTVFSTSVSKKEEALNVLGADNFVISSDEQQMKTLAGSLDFIIDSAAGQHHFDPYLCLLKTFGTYVLVGFPKEVKFSPASMKTFSGSTTGGTKVTQEMLEFCAAKKVYPKVEVVPIEYANEAFERLVKRYVKYRFVIDIENSLN
uniref:Enoyl reductase (ER) domain-containing protein n=1 Tax=Chenopodium quinoa TaxID=63459 RepID=A0A803LHQ5_CHEQI